jgi:sulfite reductase (NADPH) flavoprotein alpha-component
MLPDNKLTLLKELINISTAEELIWSKGYIAGFLEGKNATANNLTTAAPALVAVKPVIIYGTETGNAKKVASGLLASFKKKKINARSVDIFGFDPLKLEKEELALFIVSTQGEGEFPLNAQAFYEKLTAKQYKLDKLSYAVFGLGDSSYPLFNQAAVLLDEALTKQGAKSVLPLVKADVSYKDEVLQWEQNLEYAITGLHPNIVAFVPAGTQKTSYQGKISHSIVLNDTGSNKETHHIEITTDEAVDYLPGDSLGIYAKNEPVKINAILNLLGVDSNALILVNGENKTAAQWLEEKNILGLSKRSVKSIGEVLNTNFTGEITDLEDLLSQTKLPEGFDVSMLFAQLLPIAPRLYSISSSPEAHNGEVHLTVTLNTFLAHGIKKHGLASQYLTTFSKDTPLDFYIHRNDNFRLPDDSLDIIMIGPGTGIAPFRSFLAHRDATGAEGKNWLFFGEQHFALDFYYQTEIQDWLTSGVLTHLDVAFSRDQQHKIYVQDRIREKAAAFDQWLQDGALVYICGQKSPMSTDVEKAIIEVIASQRGINHEAAAQVLETLENEGRYLKDVY